MLARPRTNDNPIRLIANNTMRTMRIDFVIGINPKWRGEGETSHDSLLRSLATPAAAWSHPAPKLCAKHRERIPRSREPSAYLCADAPSAAQAAAGPIAGVAAASSAISSIARGWSVLTVNPVAPDSAHAR